MFALKGKELRSIPAPVTIHSYQTRYQVRASKEIDPRDTRVLNSACSTHFHKDETVSKEHSHVARNKLWPPFFLEGVRQLKLILVSFPFQGAE